MLGFWVLGSWVQDFGFGGFGFGVLGLGLAGYLQITDVLKRQAGALRSR